MKKITVRIYEAFTDYALLKACILPGQTVLWQRREGPPDLVYLHSDGHLYHTPMQLGEKIR